MVMKNCSIHLDRVRKGMATDFVLNQEQRVLAQTIIPLSETSIFVSMIGAVLEN